MLRTATTMAATAAVAVTATPRTCALRGHFNISYLKVNYYSGVAEALSDDEASFRFVLFIIHILYNLGTYYGYVL